MAKNIKIMLFVVTATNWFVGEEYSKPYKFHYGEDAIERFLNDVLKSEYGCRVIERKFSKLLVRTKRDCEDFDLINLLYVEFVKDHLKKVMPK